MKIFDVFSYNGEMDMLKIHLNTLDPYIDKFFIVEAKHTFTGKPKKLYFSEQERFFEGFWKKIEYHIINENYTKEEFALAENSPNTIGASHWKNEFLQKESIKKALKGLENDDYVLIGDVDEIWDPSYWPQNSPEKLRLRVYAYYLNNRSSEPFWGTVGAYWRDIKDKCLNHVRSDTSIRGDTYGGWHFTSIGGTDEVRRKLDASYTEESYNTPEVQALLQERVEQGVDYLGRDFQFQTDESEWPEWLTENRKKFQNLLKPTI